MAKPATPNPTGFRKAKHPRRAQRQSEARARQAASDKLSPRERLASLDQLGLVATKERAKLARQLKAA